MKIMDIIKRNNIYPRTEENIEAVLLFYFPNEKHSVVKTLSYQLYDERKLKLNEIEYLAEVISVNMSFFKEHINLNVLTAVNLINLAYQAIYLNEEEWSGSVNRIKIIESFRNTVIK